MNYILSELSSQDIEDIEAFADKRMKDGAKYRARGGLKRADITTGAAAEIGVYKALIRAGIDVGLPDFTIHSKAKKSYNPDLTDGNFHFMVKGQNMESASRYSASWLFQKEDPFLKVPTPDTYIITCVVDYDKRVVYIYACLSLFLAVKEDLFRETVLAWYGRTKIALYLRDMTKALTAGERWGILYERGK